MDLAAAENNITLAIDASTKSTGVAIYKNKELIKYQCITSSSKDVLTRIKFMVDELEKIYNDYNITQVIIEDVLPDNLTEDNNKWMKNRNTFKALMYLQAAILLMLHHYKADVELIGATSWRKRCGIKQGYVTRDILKARDIEFVKNKFNISVNDDIADAICIGWAKVNTQPEPAAFNWE